MDCLDSIKPYKNNHRMVFATIEWWSWYGFMVKLCCLFSTGGLLYMNKHAKQATNESNLKRMECQYSLAYKMYYITFDGQHILDTNSIEENSFKSQDRASVPPSPLYISVRYFRSSTFYVLCIFPPE